MGVGHVQYTYPYNDVLNTSEVYGIFGLDTTGLIRNVTSSISARAFFDYDQGEGLALRAWTDNAWSLPGELPLHPSLVFGAAIGYVNGQYGLPHTISDVEFWAGPQVPVAGGTFTVAAHHASIPSRRINPDREEWWIVGSLSLPF